MIHVEKFNDLDKMEDRLNEIHEAYNEGRHGEFIVQPEEYILNIDTFATDEGWYATVIWRDK